MDKVDGRRRIKTTAAGVAMKRSFPAGASPVDMLGRVN